MMGSSLLMEPPSSEFALWATAIPFGIREAGYQLELWGISGQQEQPLHDSYS